MTSKSGDGEAGRNHEIATRLAHAGRDPSAHHGYVNTPVYHASTILYPSAEAYIAHRSRYQYGRRGTPTSEAFQMRSRTSRGPSAKACACCLRACRDFGGPACRCCAPATVFS
jgi:cystathionine beta-lyase